MNCSYKAISYWKEPVGWISEAKTSFTGRNFELIKTKLLALNSNKCTYDIFEEALNPFIYVSNEYKMYFNNCREAKDWKYPVMSIVISYNDKNDFIQDHFEFLRTDNGYKLISIQIGKGRLH